MNRLIKLLLALLIGQLLISGWIWQARTAPDPQLKGALLSDLSAIDEIRIYSGDDQAHLRRAADGWILPDYGSLPVTEARISELLNKLEQLQRGWPVASSEAAAARFEVADDQANRTVEIYKQGKLQAKLLLGNSPAFKQRYLRLAGDSEIYTVALEDHDLPATDKVWLDKQLLRIEGTITSVTAPSFSLQHTTAGWLDQSGAAVSDSAAVDRWLERLSGIYVTQMMHGENSTALLASTPDYRLTLVSDGQPVQLDFYLHEERAFIKSSARPELFEMAKFLADSLIKADLSAFAETPDGAEANPS